MHMTWRDKTCEHCVFRVGDECRRFPPTASEGTALDANYPRVREYFNKDYMSACAEYSEDGNTQEDAFRQLAEAAKRLQKIRNQK